MIKYLLSATELEIFMNGQPAFQPTQPTYDASAVENTIGYMFHIVTDFFAPRPHVVPSEKEDRSNLFLSSSTYYSEPYSTQNKTQTSSEQSS